MTEKQFKTYVADELPSCGSDGYTGLEAERGPSKVWDRGPLRDWLSFEAFMLFENELKLLPAKWAKSPRVVRIRKHLRRAVRNTKSKTVMKDVAKLPPWVKPPLKQDGGIDPIEVDPNVDTSGITRGHWDDDRECYCIECHHWFRNKSDAAINKHIKWHQDEHTGTPGMVGTGDNSSNETRMRFFVLWGLAYGISFRAMADRMFLPYALGLKGFKLWGREKIVRKINQWAKAVYEAEAERLKSHAQMCWVECDTTTQKGNKHVLAAIVHYFDMEKRM
jgi:hypothetical protein